MTQGEYLTPLGGFSEAGDRKLTEMSLDCELFSKYLRYQGHMFKLSPSITLEFFVQKPQAYFIGTAEHWKTVNSPVRQGERAVQFIDHEGKITSMYDFSQCDSEVPPFLWTVTNLNANAIRRAIGIPEQRSIAIALTEKACTGTLVKETVMRLGIPANQYEDFGKSMMYCRA